MRVFGTNTSVGTYSAFWPISPLGSHSLPQKREHVQTVRSFGLTW